MGESGNTKLELEGISIFFSNSIHQPARRRLGNHSNTWGGREKSCLNFLKEFNINSSSEIRKTPETRNLSKPSKQ